LETRHGKTEFLTTTRYIEKYLQKGNRILDIGAATGRYSHYFADLGYDVDAIELLEHNIEIFKQNIKKGNNITIAQGDARDLKAFADNAYDITLLFGPLYHLYTTEDKLQAISEAIRTTKPGGKIFAAYCMADASILTYGFVGGGIHDLIDKKLLDTVTFETHSNIWDIFELHRKEDIDALMANFKNVTRLHYVATDGYAIHMRGSMADWDDKTFDIFMDYHFATCERQDMVGITHHVLDVFQKDF